jgi:alcohol dehydrogenase class IV
VGIVYTLGESIALLSGIKKGICMGVLLPHHLDLKMKKKERVRDELLLSLTDFDTYAVTPKSERAPRAIEQIKKLMADCKGLVPKNLIILIKGKHGLEEIVDLTMDRYGKQVKESDCRELINAAYE